MKKNTIKAFTLVEMLIVIVIIGILIASLMPRMQSAQWRARDVARKNDLAQIQTAVITSQQDKWYWPGIDDGALSGMAISGISQKLLDAGMSSVPADPNGSNIVSWLWKNNALSWDNAWQYWYMVTKRNGIDKWWFVLMARTEVEWWSNWVVCAETTNATWKEALKEGIFEKDVDLKDVVTCDTLDKVEGSCSGNTAKCTYSDTAQLRYILLY